MRMLLSFECPGVDLKKYDRYNDYYFVIPLLMEDPIYLQFMKDTKKYIMLDNGVYESGIPDMDNLLDLARQINAKEVVLPDYLFETERTREATRSFIESLSNEEKTEFRWMLVPQANTIFQWIDAYTSFIEEFGDFAYSIGVPKCPGKPLYFRTVAIQTLYEREQLVNKPHHLLGMNDPSEIMYMRFARSMDTSWPHKKDTHREVLRRMNLLRSLAR